LKTLRPPFGSVLVRYDDNWVPPTMPSFPTQALVFRL
jgi:hypothetical protein